MKILAIVAAALAANTAFAQQLNHFRVDDPNARKVGALLVEQGYDVLEGSISGGSFEIIASPETQRMLEARGLDLTLLQEGKPFREIQLERWAAQGGAPESGGYNDLSQINSRMSAAAASNPTLCQFVNLTQKYISVPGVTQTWEGRDHFAVKISDNVTQDEDEPTMLIVSAHHSRELVTPEIALTAMQNLLSIYNNPGHAQHAQVKAAVDNYEIWIVPVWNVDGYEYVFNVNNNWRKNRRVFASSVGVDLNRNYPAGWGTSCGGSTNPSSDTYRGPSEASEAETQLMIAFHEDKRFEKLIDYHSSGREVLWSYGTCWQHPLNSFLQSEAIALSNASTYGGANRRPSANGEHYEMTYLRTGTHAFLIETHSSFQPSYTSALAEADRLWAGILWMFNRPVSISGHVTDAATGLPLNATITFGLNYTHGETNTSGGKFGRYRQMLPTGNYNATFFAPGYFEQSFPISIASNSTAIVLDVALSTGGCPTPSVSVTNGVGFNPLCFSSLNDPELGTTWNVQVDTTAFMNVQWSAVWARVGNGGSYFFDPGEVLVGLQSPVAFNSFMAGSGVMVHSHAIPNNPALAGQNWVVQGLCGRDDRFVKFCNALDVTLGCAP
jgi:hypothetical protein